MSSVVSFREKILSHAAGSPASNGEDRKASGKRQKHSGTNDVEKELDTLGSMMSFPSKLNKKGGKRGTSSLTMTRKTFDAQAKKSDMFMKRRRSAPVTPLSKDDPAMIDALSPSLKK